MKQKGFAPIFILIGILIFVAVGGGAYFFGKSQTIKPQPSAPVACTEEALVCPDGSAVGRTGPNCEFAPCLTTAQNQTETADWKTYTDSNLNYSFQYPPTACELQRVLGDNTFSVCYFFKGSDGGSKHNNGYIISLDFISKNQLSLMGETYCATYPNNTSRCELFKTDKITTSIDWGTGTDGKANVRVSHPNGGIITFNLQPVPSESKEVLKQILSTFKFLDTNIESGKYSCPLNGWENCMPVLNTEGQKQCSREALEWKKINCPGFKGAAY